MTGDRARSGKRGIERLSGARGDCLFRSGTKRFDVYNRRGGKVSVLGSFKWLKPEESGEKVLYYEREGEYKPSRFRVLRKTREAEEKGLEALRKTRMRKHGDKESSEAQTAYNRYVIIVASITDAAPELTLELYQQRRRIEPAFKRLKPLFKRRKMPARVGRSVLSWFYGKLLLAAICEAWAGEGRFSPSEGKRA